MPGTFRDTAMDFVMASADILPLHPHVTGDMHEEQLGVTFEPLPPLTTKCELHRDPNCIDERCVDTFFDEDDPFDESLELQLALLLGRHVARASQYPEKHSTAPGEIVKVLEESGQKQLQTQNVVVSSAARSDERRPYLLIKARGFMRHMGTLNGFEKFDGTIQFCSKPARNFLGQALLETSLIGVWKQAARIHIGTLVSVTEESIDILIGQVSNSLPGRTLEDCQLFLNDCKMIFFGALFKWWMVDPLDSEVEQILDLLPGLLSGVSRISYLNESRELFTVNEPLISMNTTLQVAAVGEKRNTKLSTMSIRLHAELGVGRTQRESHLEFTHQVLNRSLDSLSPYKQFKGGSSDIQDICWDCTGERFAIATVTLKDAYNRPGN
ncbi:hypothetical protein RUND412_006174 [Rhizina undulata]